MHVQSGCGILALGLTIFAIPAYATPTAGQILAGYNLIVSGNDSSQSDVEGNAVIGGSITKGHTFFNNNVPAKPSVTLYGSITHNQINLDSGGSLYAPASQPGKVNYNGGGSYLGAPSDALTTYTAPLAALSSSLSGLVDTGSTLTVSGSTATFDAKPGDDGIAVFDLAASTLEGLRNVNIVFALEPGVTGVIVNVGGIDSSSFALKSSVNWNQPAQTDVLFNFYDATSTVTLRDWEASVLAPDATVKLSAGNLEGTLFAEAFSGGGELHNFTYQGALPGTAVPEPSTLAVLGLGLLGLGLVKKRS